MYDIEIVHYVLGYGNILIGYGSGAHSCDTDNCLIALLNFAFAICTLRIASITLVKACLSICGRVPLRACACIDLLQLSKSKWALFGSVLVMGSCFLLSRFNRH